MAQEKTDLKKILSISGFPGLYRFVAQSRNGAIAESLADGSRRNYPANGKISSLSDISIYTDDGEMNLEEVFEALHKALGDNDAPSAKDTQENIRAVFEKAIPTYDRDRFLFSHMKKVVSWYNELKNHASLDFLKEEDEPKEEEK